MSTNNALLNRFLAIADADYTNGRMEEMSHLLAIVDRRFFPLSIIPQV